MKLNETFFALVETVGGKLIVRSENAPLVFDTKADVVEFVENNESYCKGLEIRKVRIETVKICCKI